VESQCILFCNAVLRGNLSRMQDISSFHLVPLFWGNIDQVSALDKSFRLRQGSWPHRVYYPGNPVIVH